MTWTLHIKEVYKNKSHYLKIYLKIFLNVITVCIVEFTFLVSFQNIEKTQPFPFLFDNDLN